MVEERKVMDKDIYTRIGSLAFLVGILIALLVGGYTAYTIESDGLSQSFLYTSTGGTVAWILAVLGAIVGLITILGKGTITAKEGPAFLIAGIALIVMAGAFWGWATVLRPYIGALFAGVSMCLGIFVAPAVGILSIKLIWDIGKEV